MSKIQLEKTAGGVVIRQYVGETLNEVTIPDTGGSPYRDTAAAWLSAAHTPGDSITIGGGELDELPS